MSARDTATGLVSTIKMERRRDLAFVVVALALAAIVLWPGRDGAGTSISTMQTVGSVAAMAVAAVGLNLLIGFAKLVSLGQGAFYAIGAYGSAWLTLNGAMPPLLAIVVAIVGSGVIGAVVAVASMRLRGPQFAVITLVLAVLVERILAESDTFGRLSGYPNPTQHGTGTLDPIEVFGLTLHPPAIAGEPGTVLIPIAILTVIVLVLSRNLARSSWGRSLRAIGESELLAAHLGVDVFARKVVVFVVASALGALGGTFAIQVFGHLQPETFGLYLTITIVLAVVLGGAGTVLGPVVGAAVIIWLQDSPLLFKLETLQRELLPGDWLLSAQGLIGLLLVATLFVVPRGVVGSLSSVVRRRFRMWGRDSEAGIAVEEPTTPSAVMRADLPDKPLVRRPPNEGSSALLAVTGVGKRFGGLQAVADLSLEVHSGTIHAVIGPNGAGKSTLANLLTGIYRPDEGKVAFAGADITGLPPHQVVRKGIGRTFQTPQLFGHETVLENVQAGFRETGTLPLWRAALKPPAEYRRAETMRARALQLLEDVGLVDLAGQAAGELSYGKQRALEIARALASEPRLMILDEPAAGLNPTEVEVLGDLLLHLRDDGLALVVVEHHMDLVTRVSDEVTCMAQGRRLAHGRPLDVLEDEKVVAAYLGRAIHTEEVLQ